MLIYFSTDESKRLEGYQIGIKLFALQCHRQNLMPIREWVQTHKLNIYWHTVEGEGGLCHPGAVQMFNFPLIHGDHLSTSVWLKGQRFHRETEPKR